MLASLLIDPEQPGHRLDTVALLHLNYKMIPLSDLIGEGDKETSIDTVPLAQVTSYASEDTDIVLPPLSSPPAKAGGNGHDRPREGHRIASRARHRGD